MAESKKRHYWTLVCKGTKAAILPFDCNPHSKNDDGLLVYYSYQAARAASTHQKELYGIDCEPCRLGEED